jgi:hypothetical protein
VLDYAEHVNPLWVMEDRYYTKLFVQMATCAYLLQRHLLRGVMSMRCGT